MAMSKCQKCGKYKWSYTKIEDRVRASCGSCGNIVEWTPRKKKPVIYYPPKKHPEDFPEFKIQGILFFDGGLDVKEEKATWGFVLRIGGKQYSENGHVLPNTSNMGEQSALLHGLRFALGMNVTHIAVFGDSKLIINQAKDEWGCNKEHMRKNYNEIQQLLKKFNQYLINWIPRELNEEADFMTRTIGKKLQPGIYNTNYEGTNAIEKS